MNLTSPDNIAYATTADDLSVEDISAAQATSVQDAFNDKINNTRQKQTYRWANSAARTAQTGMQAGDVGYQVDTAMDYIYTGSAWRLNTGGLVLVTKQTLTASTGVNMDGIFTSAFRNYRVIVEGVGSTSNALTLVLRTGGTASTTGYDLQANNSNGGSATPAAAQVLNAASWSFSAVATTQQVATLDLMAPAVAIATQGVALLFSTPNPATAATTTRLDARGLLHRSLTAYDGLGLAVSTGTFTGSIAVYGYA